MTGGRDAAGRWTAEKKLAFEVLAPAALCLVATDGPVSVTLWGPGGEAVRRIGHNRGVWPARVARTTQWRDVTTATYDKNPLMFCGTQFRLWSPTAAARDRLAEATVDFIAQRAEADGGLEQLDHEFQDLGPDLDLNLFELEICDIARRIGVPVWDDTALDRLLDRILARAQQLSNSGEINRRLIGLAAQREAA